MDYQPQNPRGGGYNPYPNGMPVQPFAQKPNGENMATASMVIGIITLIGFVLLRLTLPFLLGGIGIILAILSKGGTRKMNGRAKAGMICCITGLCLDIALCVLSVWFLVSLPKLSPYFAEELNKVCEEQYGVSYDEMMDEIYDIWNMDELK